MTTPSAKPKLSPAGTSIFVFGLYLAGLGAWLVLLPNTLFAYFGVPPSTEVWPRVVGMLVMLLVFYYVMAALENVTKFFQWTVYARATVIVFFTAFVLAGFSPPILLLFGVIDLFGAGWTWLMLRRNG